MSFADELVNAIESRIARSMRYHYPKTMALKQRIAILESAERRHQGEIAALLKYNKSNQRALMNLKLSLELATKALENTNKTIETINEIYVKEKMKKPWWKFWK